MPENELNEAQENMKQADQNIPDDLDERTRLDLEIANLEAGIESYRNRQKTRLILFGLVAVVSGVGFYIAMVGTDLYGFMNPIELLLLILIPKNWTTS